MQQQQQQQQQQQSLVLQQQQQLSSVRTASYKAVYVCFFILPGHLSCTYTQFPSHQGRPASQGNSTSVHGSLFHHAVMMSPIAGRGRPGQVVLGATTYLHQIEPLRVVANGALIQRPFNGGKHLTVDACAGNSIQVPTADTTAVFESIILLHCLH
jgi:hypothetical protein